MREYVERAKNGFKFLYINQLNTSVVNLLVTGYTHRCEIQRSEMRSVLLFLNHNCGEACGLGIPVGKFNCYSAFHHPPPLPVPNAIRPAILTITYKLIILIS
jgi:hypothetical protein